MRGRSLFLLGVAIVAGGCVRAGYLLGADGSRSGDATTGDRPRGESGREVAVTARGDGPREGIAGPAVPVATKANDVCATALVVDLKNLVEPVRIQIDVTGASADYTTCQPPLPEVVIKLQNVPSSVTAGCEGGDDLGLSKGSACPPVGACSEVGCDGSAIGAAFPNPAYLLVRRASTAGAATLILRK